MNKTVWALVATAAILSACGQKPADDDAAAEPAASAAAAEPEKPVVRQATFDPNLKPAQIVWDSPEKKARWEERQRALAAQKQPVAAPAPAPAPVAPAKK